MVTNNKTTSTYCDLGRPPQHGCRRDVVDGGHLPIGSGPESCAFAVGTDALGNLYVAGRASDTSGNLSSYHWIVRKSTNGGNSWTTVDDYQLPANYSGEAHAFATDANGNLFVAGYAITSTNAYWIVRESVGGTGPGRLWTHSNMAATRTRPPSLRTPRATCSSAAPAMDIGS